MFARIYRLLMGLFVRQPEPVVDDEPRYDEEALRPDAPVASPARSGRQRPRRSTVRRRTGGWSGGTALTGRVS